MAQTRIVSAHLTKKNTLKAKYTNKEIGRSGMDTLYDTEQTKKTTQEVHRDLIYAYDSCVPHLMFSTQLIDKSVAIPADMEPEKYFKDWHWENDSRFDDIHVTGIKTFGKHAIEGIYLYGHKITEHGDVVELRSPLISLDRDPNNNYPLHILFGAQIETLLFEIDAYLTNGKSVADNQLSMELK